MVLLRKRAVSGGGNIERRETRKEGSNSSCTTIELKRESMRSNTGENQNRSWGWDVRSSLLVFFFVFGKKFLSLLYSRCFYTHVPTVRTRMTVQDLRADFSQF